MTSRRTLVLGALSAGLEPTVGARQGACRLEAFEGDWFVVCPYDPRTDDLRLAWRAGDGAALGSLKALRAFLGPDAGRVRFAMNAGMYDPARRPVGLFIDDGRTLRPIDRHDGPGNFYLKPNGVFWAGADGAPHVSETEAFAVSGAKPRWATQSGPLLVQAGRLHPRISANGTSLAVRNAVGVKDGRALFVISQDKVSFGRLARFLRDGLGCADALYLDGAVSSLWAPGLDRQDRRQDLGTFAVVLDRADAG